ncbi:MAG: helix-turn-helix transcriptional regulator [Candidatus Binatus sp.]
MSIRKATTDRTLASTKDWSQADIVAALWNKQLSLRKLSIANGYMPGTLANALQKAWPKAEQIIADAIGVEPSVIWPSRYAHRAERARQKAMRQ